MRKFLSFLLAAALLLSLVPTGILSITASAASSEQDEFTYEVHDGKATITGCTSEDIYTLDIPHTIDGYPVVSIGTSAFQGYTNLMDVFIPEGVETIESFAFYECENLQFLYLPDSLISIGEKAFFYCKSLMELEFGDNLKSIGDGAFSYCYELPFYLEFPEGLESIGMGAFYYCASLETVLLPNSLKDLGSKSFAMCGSLDYIYIPDGVTRIGSQVLYQSACYYYSSNWYGDAFYIGLYLLEAKKSISGSYTTLKGITNIADGAFENCYSLTEVVLPDSLQVIGTSAFDSCYELQSINIPSGVTTIGDKAFYECKAATDIQLPDSVEHLGQDVFTKTGYYSNTENWENNALYVGNHLVSCKPALSDAFQVRPGTISIVSGAMKGLTKLTELTMPDTLTTIGSEAVSGCTALTLVTISDGVTSIGEKAFYGCTALKNLHLGKEVSQIGDRAFGQCSSLESITVHDENEVYSVRDDCLILTQDKCLALGCKNSQIPQDGSVTSIGAYAFEGCSGLTQLTIPDTILTIGEGAFRDCNFLTDVNLGNGVQVVGKRAFEECDILSQLDLGQSVHTIDDYGFAYNHQLTHVEFPASLRYLGEEAFSNCTGLVSVSFSEGLLSIGKNCFYLCENLTDLHLPDSLLEIKDGAFYCCEKIGTLELGEGLTTIGSAAFYGCEALVDLTIPHSVQTIGSSAFYECTALQQVDLGNVEKIGYSAFESCKSLTQIHIPASVTTMGRSVFAYCPAIEEMTVSPQNPYYHSQGNCIIQTEEKKLVFGCKNSIIPADGSVTVLDSYSFAGCRELKSIVVPDQVTRICQYTFYECPSLEFMQLPFVGGEKHYDNYIGFIFGGGPTQNDLFVPDTLERIIITGGANVGTSAFSKCSGLKEIVLPESVTTISYSAFEQCPNLQRVIIPGNLKQIKDKNILENSPNAKLYISAGQDSTAELLQSMGLPYQLGGLITFLDEEGQCIDKVWYRYGQQIVAPEVPEQDTDPLFWKPAPDICTGNQTLQLSSTTDSDEPVCAHTSTVILSAKDATCTETGYTGDQVCTACGITLQTGTSTQATGHSWGDWEESKPATSTETGEENRSCTTCGLEETRSTNKLSDPFVDVIAGKFYETAVQWAVENEITNGIDDTHFAPDNICNRGQVVTFLWRAAGSPEPTSSYNPFTDVKEGKFYYKAVLWAVEEGITKGTSATTFSPNDNCTRGHVATFLWRTLGEPKASSSTNPFTDVAQGRFYYDAVLWAAETGVTTGMTATTFEPNTACTRGQIVTFLYRALG